jgi:hypothetical protein
MGEGAGCCFCVSLNSRRAPWAICGAALSTSPQGTIFNAVIQLMAMGEG